MNFKFLNVGPLELVFILIIAFLILGPNETIKTAKKIGGWVRKFMRSSEWSTIVNTSKEFRNLPGKIIQEAGLEESINEIKQDAEEITKGINQQIDISSEEIDKIPEKIAQDTGAGESIKEIKANLDEVSSELDQKIEIKDKKSDNA